MRKQLSITGTLIFVLLASACQQSITETEPIISSPTKIEPTVLAKETAVPPTASIPPIESSEPPTATKPTVTTPISSPTPDQYELPDWLGDPKTAVLMNVSYDNWERSEYISFFNATTGERFDLPVPRADNIAWTQWKNETYFQYDQRYATQIDAYTEFVNISTGKFERTDISDGKPSPDNRYIAIQDRIEDGTKKITIREAETGQEIILSDPFNGQFFDYASMEWSPSANLLSVSLENFNENLPSDGGTIIYDSEGNILNIIEGAIYPIWSSDDHNQLLYSIEDRLCILQITETIPFCTEAILDWQKDQNNVDTSSYQWSPDGTQISFIYWAYPYDAGLCLLNLTTDEINCPIDATVLENEGPRYIVGPHQWAPDGKHIGLFINHQGPSSDDVISTSVALFHLGDMSFEDMSGIYSGSFKMVWRPLLR